MCKRAYDIQTGACRHRIETPGSLVPDADCKGCGIEKGRNDNIAATTSHTPCDDCQHKGLWVKRADGKWYEAAKGAPKPLPSFRYPSCQSFLQGSRFCRSNNLPESLGKIHCLWTLYGEC
ncbi:conserved hypothetical protein [Coccidioides posadasii str. Silveira]|uniref:Uncharacterized protein n=1 Tax=Coccidioides posadasii (strain RMSCC 757 / Silveira) TaxID=443226 RepID=E9DH43_COCPS|nr:conserved hypothetical protein [Coccidioides posadasii str. Silveira]